jgi:crotonobetainyl-CoA:carnitine CoA-transferase CaiB-like acyl-CoA transferase
MTKVMSGIRVVEVADYVFVPSAGAILADWGAEVVKVEHHERGDAMRGRRTGRAAEPLNFNADVETVNRGKRSIGLNLSSAEGVEVLMSLVQTADVFLTSKLPTVRRKLGFDVGDVRRRNPAIVYARGSARGVRGPEAEKGGFDALDFWYRSGTALAMQVQEVDYPPFMPSGAYGDLTGGMNLAGGVAAALLHRALTGETSTVDVSLLGSGVWSFGKGLQESLQRGVNRVQRPRGGTYNPLINTYQTSDGRWIALCCLQAGRYWPHLCRVLDREDLLHDPRFGSDLTIGEHCAEAVEILFEIFAQRTLHEWVTRLATFEGQWSVVQEALMVPSDPQVVANDYLVEAVSSTGESFSVPSPPVQFNETLARPGRAPAFNESGDELLMELGYTAAQVIELRRTKAVT